MTTPQTTCRASNIRSVPPPRTMEFHHVFPKAPTAASTRLQGNRAAAAQAALHPYHTPYVNQAPPRCPLRPDSRHVQRQQSTHHHVSVHHQPTTLQAVPNVTPVSRARCTTTVKAHERHHTQAHTHTHCPLYTRHTGRQEGQHTQGSTRTAQQTASHARAVAPSKDNSSVKMLLHLGRMHTSKQEAAADTHTIKQLQQRAATTTTRDMRWSLQALAEAEAHALALA